MDKLAVVRRRAKKIGLRGEIEFSRNKTKKYSYIREDGKRINFGAVGYEDFLDHRDLERRKSFRKRFEGITLSDGRKAIDVVGSPAYLSYYLLW